MKTSLLKEGLFYQLHQPRQGGCDMPSLCGRFLGVDSQGTGQAKLRFQLAEAIHARDWQERAKLHSRVVLVAPAAVVGEWGLFAERMARVMSFRASTRLLGSVRIPLVVSRAERLGIACTQRADIVEISNENMAALLDMAERKAVRKC